MTLNLTCCRELNLSSLICCKNEKESPSPSPVPSPVPSLIPSPVPSLGKMITVIESDKIHFNTLLPDHKEYIYLKILANERIIAAEGEFMDDLDMTKGDFLGRTICDVPRNSELFKECICPLFKRSMETGATYQFCFKIEDSPRLITCNIYPCSIPGFISSADCVIRPAIKGVFGEDMDRFVVSVI